MKRASLLFILYLVTGALAFGIRGGYERMWFWTAQVGAMKAAGRGGKAPQLVPKLTGDKSNFNDFVRYINNKKNLPDIISNPTLNIPVESTARLLHQKQATKKYYYNLILPNTGKTYGEFLGALSKTISASRGFLDPKDLADQDLIKT